MIPAYFMSAGNRLYFSAGDEQHGQELWMSDGTEAGTTAIDIIPGIQSSWPKPLFVDDKGQILFAADGHFYRAAGAGPAIDKISELEPLYVRQSGETIYFTAFHKDYGIEMFSLQNTKVTQQIDFTIPDHVVGDNKFQLSATTNSGLAVAYATTSDKITLDGINVTPNAAGHVTITASQAGDDQFNAATKDATFCINPEKPLNVVLAGIELGSLTSSSPHGNQWFENGESIPGAIDQVYTPGHSGVFTIQVTIDGCKSEMSDLINFDYTALEDEVSGLTIYPNPANEIINVSWPSEPDLVELSLVSMQGVELEKTTFQNSLSLGLRSRSNGIYLLRVKSEKRNTTYSFKLVVFH
jgi:ELWxxDGT repeat protein